MSDIYCLICSSPTTKINDVKNQQLFHYCSNCEFIFKDKKHFPTTDIELKKYGEHNNSIENTDYVKYLENFINLAVKNYTISNLALDFGSGPTPVLSQILSTRYNYIVDIYDKHYQSIKVYENKFYDCITCVEVIEHLDQPLDYLKLFKAHLNQNGIIALMTLFHPNNDELFLNWWYMRDPTHITFYTLKTFEVIAKQMDLKIIFTDNKRIVTLKKG